jgi:ABC-2 type transport system ATP-binding protein
MTTVQVRDLRVRRDHHEVLHGIGFDLSAGEVTGLLGPSGGGKTTLMRALVGVQRAVTGTVEVLGLPAGSPALRSRVGYLTQAPAVYGDLTVSENLRYFGALHEVSRDRVEEVIDHVDLRPQHDQLVSSLSGGQSARVSLATALLGSPELLVLDEPTVGLDPVLRRDLWTLFHGLAESGVTVLVSSHVMDEASRCDRLLLLRDGLLVADDSPAGLLARTGTHDVEAAFLSLADRGVTA